MLHLKHFKTKQIVAVLKNVEWRSCLEDLRARIDSELKCGKVYEFIVCGAAIKKKQEQKYEVLSCATKSVDEGGDHYLELNFVRDINSTASATQATSSIKNDPKNDRKEKIPEQVKLNAVTNKRYPDFYSKEEIDEATESFEKERRTFFNRKLTEIMQDSSLQDWGIQEIQGVIDVHWVLKKTEILKNCVKELMSNTPENESGIKRTGNTPPEEKNVMKNFDNLNKAQFMVDNHYKRLSEELRINGEIDRERLENDFDQTFSELKKAQSNLTKSIENYKAYLLPLFLAREEKPRDLTSARDQEFVVDLSDNEIDIVVESVRDDFEY